MVNYTEVLWLGGSCEGLQKCYFESEEADVCCGQWFEGSKGCLVSCAETIGHVEVIQLGKYSKGPLGTFKWFDVWGEMQR